MNVHEHRFIEVFIARELRERYRFLLSSDDARRRQECLNRLCHCRDLDERRVEWLPRNPRSTTRDDEIAAILRGMGSPKEVYVLACACPADGRTLPLLEAIRAVTASGWGAIVSCVPGELAYYFDEEGERRAILECRANRPLRAKSSQALTNQDERKQ